MKNLPQVVIVGFPNVGKSTLFNRLLRRKKSLVHSLSGMTRDPVSALAALDGKKFILTDSGGLDESNGTPLAPAVSERAWRAARRADVLLLVLDGKRDLSSAEEGLWLALRRLGKPVLPVLNKIDSEVQESRVGEFYNRLRTEMIYAVSAEHRRNLDELERALAEVLPASAVEAEEAGPLKVAIIGRINVGKSSLINRLCGEDRLIVSRLPGTTRDSTDTYIVRNRKPYALVDTAGIRKLSRTRDEREQAGIIRARKDIARADVLCLVMDAQEFPTRQDIAIAQLARESGKPLVLALNKWDLIPRDIPPDNLKEVIFRRMPFAAYAPLLFVSALTGKGVVKILDLADEVYERSSLRVETSRLNDFLAWISAARPPLSRGNRRIKIKYMTQKAGRPPTFLLFTRTPAGLLPSYEKFFQQALREKFGFWGSPIRLLMRKS
jgi:GTP-binding protein